MISIASILTRRLLKKPITSFLMVDGSCILGFVAALLLFLLFKVRKHVSVTNYSSVQPADNIPTRPKQLTIDSYKLDRATIKANVTELAARFKDSDIVVLQGAVQSGSNAVASLIAAFKAKGFKYFASGPSPKFFSTKYIDSGLLVLSKFPASINDQITFKKSTNIFATQGALYIKFRVSVFEFFHLAFAALATKSQVADLAALVERHINDNFPFFVIANGNECAALASALAIKDRQPVDFLKAKKAGDALFRLTGPDDRLVFGDIDARTATIQISRRTCNGIAATLDLVVG